MSKSELDILPFKFSQTRNMLCYIGHNSKHREVLQKSRNKYKVEIFTIHNMKKYLKYEAVQLCRNVQNIDQGMCRG